MKNFTLQRQLLRQFLRRKKQEDHKRSREGRRASRKRCITVPLNGIMKATEGRHALFALLLSAL